MTDYGSALAGRNNKEFEENDANNNSDQPEQRFDNKNNKKPTRVILKRQKTIDESEEEWQILSEDNNNSIVPTKMTRQQQVKRTITAETISDRVVDGKKYIEIDPLASHKRPPPYLLVHLATAIYSLMPLLSVLAAFILIGLLLTRYYLLSLIYFAYILIDRNTCNRGGRRINWVYNSPFYSYLAAYFPIKFRHTPDFKLNPNKNYILNYTPHGISAFGAVTGFATNGLNFSQFFPGITARFMVHETSFVTPVMKETFALRGDCSVNSKSIDHVLNKTRGNLLTIVVGGLAEADLSDERILKTVILKRKGFIKKALIHGANLIPCISFGENSVFKKVNLKPGSFLHRLESKWYQLFKFKHPIYYGRSILSSKLSGVMPYKRPITVVMGNPIEVERSQSPSQSDIDKLHTRYVLALRAMYEANRDLCAQYDQLLELL